MKLKRADIVFIILMIILTIVSIDFLLNESHRAIITNISSKEPFQNLYSGLLITFLVCLIGNLLPVPTPYTFVVCFGAQPFLHLNIFIPILVGFVASLGCLVGEMGGYAVGRGAAEFISEERSENLKGIQVYLVEHPKVAPFLIYLFGVSPLNDDFLTIPLGILKYDAKRTIFFCWLGKFTLMLVFAFNLIGICSFLGGESWIISIVSLYLLVILIYAMIRVNIVDILKKLAKKDEN